jgi:hypothetical protein
MEGKEEKDFARPCAAVMLGWANAGQAISRQRDTGKPESKLCAGSALPTVVLSFRSLFHSGRRF